MTAILCEKLFFYQYHFDTIHYLMTSIGLQLSLSTMKVLFYNPNYSHYNNNGRIAVFKRLWHVQHTYYRIIFILPAFAQINTYFPKFSPWFCTRFSTNLTLVSGFCFVLFCFGGGQNRIHVYRFLCVKSTHLGGTSPFIWHKWEVLPRP